MSTASHRIAPSALLFDVFGTCVDWRTSIARQAGELGRRYGLAGVDWDAFADAWRARYQPQMETVRSGMREWATLDVLHRESLDDVLAEFGLRLRPDDGDRLALAWHRLEPWPDAVEGVDRLRRRFIVAPASNGHIALQVNLARHAGLVWDAILGAEIAHAYKPDPHVYLRSVAALGLAPRQVMMVAAHNGDLAAAARCGLQTAFVVRPVEYGPNQTTDLAADPGVDLAAADLTELAEMLGA
jgi:2-haloacid dehalogenase